MIVKQVYTIQCMLSIPTTHACYATYTYVVGLWKSGDLFTYLLYPSHIDILASAPAFIDLTFSPPH